MLARIHPVRGKVGPSPEPLTVRERLSVRAPGANGIAAVPRHANSWVGFFSLFQGCINLQQASEGFALIYRSLFTSSQTPAERQRQFIINLSAESSVAFLPHLHSCMFISAEGVLSLIHSVFLKEILSTFYEALVVKMMMITVIMAAFRIFSCRWPSPPFQGRMMVSHLGLPITILGKKKKKEEETEESILSRRATQGSWHWWILTGVALYYQPWPAHVQYINLPSGRGVRCHPPAAQCKHPSLLELAAMRTPKDKCFNRIDLCLSVS